jgi:hypothetical protein
VSNILTDIETQGEVNALNALFEGNTAARGYRQGAAMARNESRAAGTAGYLGMASTVLKGGSSWYQKYGAGGGGYTTSYGEPETISTPDAGDLTIRRPIINY